MEIAFGPMRLSPDVFWNMSLTEWSMAVKGFNKSNGVKEKPNVRPWDDAFVTEHNLRFKARGK